jgi:hypothetical protein
MGGTKFNIYKKRGIKISISEKFNYFCSPKFLEIQINLKDLLE